MLIILFIMINIYSDLNRIVDNLKYLSLYI